MLHDTVLELVVFLRELRRQRTIARRDLHSVRRHGVFRHVRRIVVEDFLLDGRDLAELRLRIRLHGLRHAADDEICMIEAECLLMQDFRHRFARGCMGTDFFRKRFLTEREQKFLEIHRIERERLHLANGKRIVLAVDRDAEQAARCSSFSS